MRYDGQREILIATPGEIAGAAAALDLNRGPLSTTLFDVGGPDQIREFEDGLLRLVGEQRRIFETVLPVVADPVRSAMVRMYRGGSSLQRFLAWSGDGEVAAMEQLGDEIGLAAVDVGSIKAEMLAVLGTDIPFSGTDTRFVADGHELFVLVAVADALRREWLTSILDHRPAAGSVTVADVAGAVAAATADDPRWISCVLDKAVPGEFRRSVDINRALLGLVESGVLEGAESGARFEATSDADALLKGLAGAAATVAFSLYGMADERPGYETTLLARDASTVWALLISPTESFVASVSPSALVSLVEGALGILP